jgi:hypothetical protein
MTPYKPKFTEADDTKSRLTKINRMNRVSAKKEFQSLVGDSFKKEKLNEINIEDITGDATTYTGEYKGKKLYAVESEELGKFIVSSVPLGWSSKYVSFIQIRNPETIAYWYPSDDKAKGSAKEYITKLEKALPWVDTEYQQDYNIIIVRYTLDSGKKVHGYLHLEKENDEGHGFKFGYQNDNGMTEDSEPSLEKAFQELVKAIKSL